MGIIGRVFAVRLWLPFIRRDRDGPPSHSVAAGISSMHKLILPSATGVSVDHAGHPSTLTPQNGSSLDEAVHQSLILLSPIAAAIPVVGTVLNGCITTLLAVWNGIDKKNRNKEIAARLTKNLYYLQINISAIGDDTGSVRHREELARNLDVLSDRLKQLTVNSFLYNAKTSEVILDLTTEMNSHLLRYMALSCMRMEHNGDRLLENFSDNHGQLPGSVKLGIVFVMDATGREFKVLIDQCQSRKQFMKVLECYFGDNEKDRVLRHFMDRGAYDLHIEAESGITRLDGWSGVRMGTRIVMSAVFESYSGCRKYKCPRCKAWNIEKEENNSWIDCGNCPGRFQTTDADRQGATSGQNVKKSLTPSGDGYRPRLDLILNFHVKQQAIAQMNAELRRLNAEVHDPISAFVHPITDLSVAMSCSQWNVCDPISAFVRVMTDLSVAMSCSQNEVCDPISAFVKAMTDLSMAMSCSQANVCDPISASVKAMTDVSMAMSHSQEVCDPISAFVRVMTDLSMTMSCSQAKRNLLNAELVHDPISAFVKAMTDLSVAMSHSQNELLVHDPISAFVKAMTDLSVAMSHLQIQFNADIGWMLLT